MGVNFQGVDSKIHYGAPCTLDDNFQESGRGGRSGASAKSTIYWSKCDCPVRKELMTRQHHEAIAVRSYLENTTCYRQ